jgi:beta-lactamase regulating signal transducer with metallopeptidase domain
LFLLSLQIYAQQNKTVDLFDSIISSSNNYKDKKIISQSRLKTFRAEFISHLDSLNADIARLSADISTKNQTIQSLNSENATLKKDLEEARASIDRIDILGLGLTKMQYSITVWGIILLLLAAIGVILVTLRKFRIVNGELKENLHNINQEFDAYKITTLEKQQKMGRELLDLKKKIN